MSSSYLSNLLKQCKRDYDCDVELVAYEIGEA